MACLGYGKLFCVTRTKDVLEEVMRAGADVLERPDDEGMLC